MKIRDACCWCHRIVARPETFDEKRHFLVCSQACMKQKQTFRFMFSDSNIGERNMRDFGINPNHRGRRK